MNNPSGTRDPVPAAAFEPRTAQASAALIAGFWTLSGSTGPLSPSRVCPHPLTARIRAAAEAGFAGIGFAHEDLMHWLPELGPGGLAKCLRDHGLRFVELELILDWFAQGERRAASDRVRADLLAVAAEVGARHIKVVGDRSREAHWPLDALVADFAGLCDQAQAAGARIALEFQPWSAIHDLATALPVVLGAGHSHGGLMLDIWHVDRGGVPFDALAALPLGSIVAVELSDARKEVIGSLWEDTSERRQLCGQGELEVGRFIDCVRAAGFDGPFSVELISREHRARTLAEQARLAFETSHAALLARPA